LSKFQKQLIQHYEKNSDAIVPQTYYRDVVKAITQPLEDISISRPKSRLTWGIEVPGDPEQTIYVWFDALVNYLTVTGYPWANEPERNDFSIESPLTRKDAVLATANEKPTASTEYGWPAAVHVIGKDIVRYAL
jgi:methionyl-tRNA synthetase